MMLSWVTRFSSINFLVISKFSLRVSSSSSMCRDPNHLEDFLNIPFWGIFDVVQKAKVENYWHDKNEKECGDYHGFSLRV